MLELGVGSGSGGPRAPVKSWPSKVGCAGKAEKKQTTFRKNNVNTNEIKKIRSSTEVEAGGVGC